MSSNDQSHFNLSIYLFENFNAYFLYLTIIISILSVVFTLSIVFEFLIRRYFSQSIFLLNSSHYMKERFLNQLIYSLNKELFSRKVIDDFSDI